MSDLVLYISFYAFSFLTLGFCAKLLHNRMNDGKIVVIGLGFAFIFVFFFTPINDEEVKYKIYVDKKDIMLKKDKVYFYYDGMVRNLDLDTTISSCDKIIFYNTTYNNVLNSSVSNTYSYGYSKN